MLIVRKIKCVEPVGRATIPNPSTRMYVGSPLINAAMVADVNPPSGTGMGSEFLFAGYRVAIDHTFQIQEKNTKAKKASADALLLMIVQVFGNF